MKWHREVLGNIWVIYDIGYFAVTCGNHWICHVYILWPISSMAYLISSDNALGGQSIVVHQGRNHKHDDVIKWNLSICEGNSPVCGEFPSQRPVTQSFDVFFDLNKRLSKQSNVSNPQEFLIYVKSTRYSSCITVTPSGNIKNAWHRYHDPEL